MKLSIVVLAIVGASLAAPVEEPAPAVAKDSPAEVEHPIPDKKLVEPDVPKDKVKIPVLDAQESEVKEPPVLSNIEMILIFASFGDPEPGEKYDSLPEV